jgi:hypothetical protein
MCHLSVLRNICGMTALQDPIKKRLSRKKKAQHSVVRNIQVVHLRILGDRVSASLGHVIRRYETDSTLALPALQKLATTVGRLLA